MEEGDVTFHDLFYGDETRHLSAGKDDFVIRRADGLVAYQLAVSADDGAMGITHVFRGNDLLPSTAYQVYLMETLGYKAPVYGHLPLLVDGEGVRLSKRQHGITIKELREDGYRPEDLIGLLLHWAGALKDIGPVSLGEAETVPFERMTGLKERHITVL
jgi:glutamyl-tRNA synthetase